MMFMFSGDPNNVQQTDMIVSAGAEGGKYVTSKGIKPGDPVGKALKVYGKPKAMILDYGKDEQHGIHLIYYGLFYDNLIFITDKNFKTIQGFSIGTWLDLNKKYIKK